MFIAPRLDMANHIAMEVLKRRRVRSAPLGLLHLAIVYEAFYRLENEKDRRTFLISGGKEEDKEEPRKVRKFIFLFK
jgi:hypothetical protein